MKYTFRRKINLGKYHSTLQYESIDLEVSEADSPEEAEREVKEWSARIKKEIGNSLKKRVTKVDNELGF